MANTQSMRTAIDRGEPHGQEHHIPAYVWHDPHSDGWVDAWNGWYPTLDEALRDAALGEGQPWTLEPGEGLICNTCDLGPCPDCT